MYACPNCGGNLRFDIVKQTMVCPYCDQTQDPYAINTEHDAEETNYYDATVFTCPQCGAEILTEDNEAAAFCSYCGGSTVLDSRVSRFQKPDYIIPFQVTKEQCLQGYRSMMGRSLFAPKALKDPGVIDSFRGIYMPYWSYAFDKQGQVDIQGTKSYQRGDYKYTETYRLTSNIKAHYDHMSHDASSTFADNLSTAIAPFDQNNQRPFTPAYLSGFYADACDLGDNVYMQDEALIVGNDCYRQFKKESTLRKYTINDAAAKKQFTPDCSGKKLIMLPVWFMSTRVREKGRERVTYAVVNGQTGKTAGDVPIDLKRYFGISLGLAMVLFLCMNFLMDLTIAPMGTLIFCCVLGCIMYGFYHSQATKIVAQENGEDDKGRMVKRMEEETVMPVEDFDSYQSQLKKEKAKEKHKLPMKPTFIWLPFVITGLLMYANPIQDSWYYAGAIVSLAIVLRMIVLIILKFNDLVTRPLPQFNRTGGDDHANF